MRYDARNRRRDGSDMQDILGLILAGGLGRRMGGPQKPLASLGGERLIDKAIASAKAQCRAVAINLHDLTPESRAPFEGLGLPLVADALPGHAGPLAGVLAGLDYAAEKGFAAMLSLPCDCPFPPKDLAARLYEAARQTRDGMACAVSGGRAHPVIALWPTRLREKLRRALTVEDVRKVGRFQQDYDVAQVEWLFRRRDPFFNVNTVDDLVRAQDLLVLPDDESCPMKTLELKKLDLRGLKCPLPVLKTRKYLTRMAPGEKVEVACTDPLSVIDLPHLLRETGDALESHVSEAGALLFLIRKAGP